MHKKRVFLKYQKQVMQLSKSKLKGILSPLLLEKRYGIFICPSLPRSLLKQYQTCPYFRLEWMPLVENRFLFPVAKYFSNKTKTRQSICIHIYRERNKHKKHLYIYIENYIFLTKFVLQTQKSVQKTLSKWAFLNFCFDTVTTSSCIN